MTNTRNVIYYKIGQNERNGVVKIVCENEMDKEKFMLGRKKRIKSSDIWFHGDVKSILFTMFSYINNGLLL